MSLYIVWCVSPTRWRLPDLPGKRYQDWKLQDPQGQPIDTVRGIRDEVEQHVRELLKSLEMAPA
ncbi:hypothetical protein ACRAWC_09140 [Leifsonia sp. L25]|uniref:hypothetical protein n=1 Tax=Actinomycetes TaxID=1760 RepID=UPI003D69EE74